MKSGLRRAQRTYQGRATTQNEAIATGWSIRNAARQCFVARAQIPIAPPDRIIAAGPFARTASPRNAPNPKIAVKSPRYPASAGSVGPRTTPACRNIVAAQAIASVTEAEKSISGVAARENPMAATLVEKNSGARSAGLHGHSLKQ